MKKFNVMLCDMNTHKVIYYDVLPYLRSCFKKSKPKTLEEMKDFVNAWSRYQFCCRCEYEIIVSPWPYYDWTGHNLEELKKKYSDKDQLLDAIIEIENKQLNNYHKIDAYSQIIANLDIISEILLDECKK